MTGIGVSSGPVGCLTFSTVVAPCRWATAEEEDEREEEEAATTEKLPSVVRVPFGVRVYGLRFFLTHVVPSSRRGGGREGGGGAADDKEGDADGTGLGAAQHAERHLAAQPLGCVRGGV